MRVLVTLLISLGFVNGQEVKAFELKGENRWVDTGLDLKRGDRFIVEASGELALTNAGQAQTSGPEGVARGFRDLLRMLPLNSAGRGAVIGKIGERETSQPFLIGPRKEAQVAADGKLFLNVNLGANETGEGAYRVKVTITRAAATSADRKAAAAKVVEISQKQLDSLPLRVVDADGTQGDKVNFLIVGSEAKVTTALKTVGWVQVDRSVKDSIINAILISMSKQAYLTLPMSELMMFGRAQDYGFAHAVPYVVVAQRHHFRIWKAPFQVGGQDLWVGAGTHDIGFEKDQRNGKITHKIDPEVDKERDYIGQTLEESGMVVKTAYMRPKNAITEAKTAHGANFRSDGRTLVIYMEQGAANPDAQLFSNLFCSVLATNPDGGEWGDCDEYIETPATAKVDLKPINRDYRVVVVPGIFSSCASDAPAFERGRAYLKDKHQVDAELLGVPNNSSEDNAKAIAKYLREQWTKNQKKFILVGYSKGTPDIQVALATEPDIRPMVAAFVSVAGASGGSPVADSLPGRLSNMLGKVNGKGGCEGDLSDGFKSLAQEVRRQFLARYPNPFVPTYSIPAVADKDKVSKVMMQAWTMMNSFAPRNDAQLAEEDATIPGSKYLGAARSDHFALALPLENMKGGALKSFLDKNNYPRAALLEAALRFVLEDLKAPAATPVTPPAPKPAEQNKPKSIFQP
jgi:hypothetical protein